MPVALTVDVGWPWWAITAIACGVVVACLAGLVVSQSPAARAVAGLLAIEGVVIAIVAPFVMPDMNSNESAMTSRGSGMSAKANPTRTTSSSRMPFTFFFTRYEDNPSGSRFHSDGTPLAKAPDGSTITLTGHGGWDPYSGRATGGGTYVIENAGGTATAKGTWRATKFVSFRQVCCFAAGKWEGWQGPPGSTIFSGFLKVSVWLDGRGAGLLTAWCPMDAAAARALHREDDGIALVGPHLSFTNFKANVASGQGVMFYGPGSS